MQLEVAVVNKESADSTEVDRWKELLQIQIEDIPPVSMLLRVGNDGPLTLKPVCYAIFASSINIDLVDAVLKEIG
jgi:hypothetical protein